MMIKGIVPLFAPMYYSGSGNIFQIHVTVPEFYGWKRQKAPQSD